MQVAFTANGRGIVIIKYELLRMQMCRLKHEVMPIQSHQMSARSHAMQ